MILKNMCSLYYTSNHVPNNYFTSKLMVYKDCNSLTGSQWPRNTSDKDSFPRIQGLRTVHDKVAVTQVPRTNLNLKLCEVKDQIGGIQKYI